MSSPLAARILRLLFLAGLLLLAPSPAAAEPATPAAHAAWGFDRSDLTPHPGVRFGVLPNGMRYALMRNSAPAGGLSVRLRLDVGSTAESREELGLVHLLEHMVFEGTRGIPQRTLPRWLARRGLASWSDFDAFTSFHETVYRLELPRSDPAAVETGLTLMREIGSELTLSRGGLERAKAMVLAEIEGRDAVADRLASAQNAFFMPGTAVARGPVAGTAESVRRGNAATLRRLYRRYYVPERATLVLVGDFDPAAAEAQIAARFGEWSRGTAAPAHADAATIDPNRPGAARFFIDPQGPTSVTIASVTPLGGAVDAGAPRDRLFLEHLASEMLTRRLTRAAAGAGAPFAGGNSAVYDHFATARLARIEIAAAGRDWRRALQAGERELALALERGFTQAELDEQLAVSGRQLAAASRARLSAELADAIVATLQSGTVFTAPQDPDAAARYLSGVRLDDVNAAFRATWRNPARLIFVAHNEPVAGGDAALAAAAR